LRFCWPALLRELRNKTQPPAAMPLVAPPNRPQAVKAQVDKLVVGVNSRHPSS
jgi:hypothetical protein